MGQTFLSVPTKYAEVHIATRFDCYYHIRYPSSSYRGRMSNLGKRMWILHPFVYD